MLHRHRSVIVSRRAPRAVRRARDVRGDVRHDAGDVWLERQLQSVHSGAFALTLDYTSNWPTDPLATTMILAGALTADCMGAMRAGVLAALLPIARFLVPTLKATFERLWPSAALVHVKSYLAD